MNSEAVSPQGKKIATLLDSLNPQKGDLSYRMEGTLQAVSMVAALLTNQDRKHIADAILRASEAFGQYDKKVGVTTNRYALQTLQDLAL